MTTTTTTAAAADPAPAADPVDAAVKAAVTPAGLLGLLRDARVRGEQAEFDQLSLAIEWATGHEVAGPVRAEQDGASTGFGDTGPADGPLHGPWFLPDLEQLPEVFLSALERTELQLRSADPTRAARTGPPPPSTPAEPTAAEVEAQAERGRWRGLPELTWDAAAPLAAALGLSTVSGRLLLRQGLTLQHRLPRTYACWRRGLVSTRTARKVADTVAGQPDDVCGYVDQALAARVQLQQGVGPIVAERLVLEAMTRLHAEQLELDRQAALAARYARYAPASSPDGQPGPDPAGLTEFVIRGEWPDIKAFHDTLAALAAALKTSDHPDANASLDVRRSVAVGILADPTRALALLNNQAETADSSAADRKQSVLIRVDLDAARTEQPGRDPVVTDNTGRTWLDAMIRDWAGRPDVDLVVRPFVHCGGCDECAEAEWTAHARTGYAPTDLDKERLAQRTPHCVFPHCTMPARRCDTDHIHPYDHTNPTAGGPTCTRCNLAPLCRHHHNLKTHAGWTHHQTAPGVFTWHDPHGQTYLVTRWATTDTTPGRERAGPPPRSRPTP